MFKQLTGNESRAFLTLYKTVGELENLRCDYLALNHGELIQLLQRYFHIILSQKLLSNFDCVVFS
jgi:hypothetical protein